MIAETATGALATKGKSLAVYFGISVPAVAFLGLDIDLLLIWCIFIIIDVILGTAIGFWLKKFSSRTSQDRFGRKGVLLVIVMCVAFMGTVYSPVAYVAQTMLMAFTIAELVSIIRHCYTIYSKERLPESEVIKNIILGSISLLEKLANGKSGNDKK